MNKDKNIEPGWWAIAISIKILIDDGASKEEVKDRIIQIVDDMFFHFKK